MLGVSSGTRRYARTERKGGLRASFGPSVQKAIGCPSFPAINESFECDCLDFDWCGHDELGPWFFLLLCLTCWNLTKKGVPIVLEQFQSVLFVQIDHHFMWSTFCCLVPNVVD